MYEYQKDGKNNLEKKAIISVWIININPIVKGWDKIIKIELVKIIIDNKKKISENSLFKILTLEVNDAILLFWSL